MKSKPDYLIEKMDNFIKRKSGKVTTLPVFVKSAPSNDPTAGACIYPWLDGEGERVAWQIEFAAKYFYMNRNDPVKLKQIACHELAHIRAPMIHTREFKRIARSLGAGKYSDTGMG